MTFAPLALVVLVAGAAPDVPPSSSSSPSSAAPSSPSSAAPSSPSSCAALRAEDAWIRVLPPGTRNTAAFARLTNTGPVDVVVVGAASPVARRAELHEHSRAGGVMKMRAVPSIVVPAHGAVTLAPGGLHVMLFDQTAPKEGERRSVTLRCADGSTVVVDAVASSAPPPVPPPVPTPPTPR